MWESKDFLMSEFRQYLASWREGKTFTEVHFQSAKPQWISSDWRIEPDVIFLFWNLDMIWMPENEATHWDLNVKCVCVTFLGCTVVLTTSQRSMPSVCSTSNMLWLRSLRVIVTRRFSLCRNMYWNNRWSFVICFMYENDTHYACFHTGMWADV